MPQYTNDIAITFPGGTPLVGCANNTRAISNAIDNTTGQYDSVDIEVTLKFGATGVVAGGFFTIAYFGSDDGGVTYDTLIQANNTLEQVTNFVANGNKMTVRVQLTKVPEFWKLVVANFTGAAFDTTALNFNSIYAGITDVGQIPLATSQTSVTTSSTLLAAANKARKNLVVSNLGSQTVFLGTNVVTTGQGFPLLAGATLEFDNLSGNALYGIVAATTANVAVMQY